MTNTSSQKGDRVEREAVNLLDESGWAVIRAPASGSATQRDLPDVICSRPTNALGFDNNPLAATYAMEVKASGGDPIYVDQAEVAALRRFASSWGATPLVCAKFDLVWGHPDRGTDRSGIYVLPIGDCHHTDGGNVRVKRETAVGEGTLLEEL